MGSQTSLNVYTGTTVAESSAIVRIAVNGLKVVTVLIAGLAQLDDLDELE